MNIELEIIRKSYGMNKADFAKLIDMKEFFYSQYEQRKELPSKYVYVLWTKLKNFPIPDDFFFFFLNSYANLFIKREIRCAH